MHCQDSQSQLSCRVEILQTFGHPSTHGLFAFSHPDSGVKELLVGLILAVWVANRSHQVVLLLQNIITDTRQVGKLQIRVKVDLDHTMADGIRVFLFGGSGPSVEDKVHRLVLFGAGLLLDERLVLAQKFRVQFHVARLVHAMNISEACSNREVRADFGQSGPDVVDIFGLGVQRVVVDILVVDAIFLTTSNADFLLHLAFRSFLGEDV